MNRPQLHKSASQCPMVTMKAEDESQFRSSMEQYHARVFEAATSARHTELVNVWWAYNRYAERKQHTAMFKTTEMFARCLRDHHAPPP